MNDARYTDMTMILFCRRCGRNRLGIRPDPRCVHGAAGEGEFPVGVGVGVTSDPARAERIRARYEIGKRFNANHDTADYYSEPGALSNLKMK